MSTEGDGRTHRVTAGPASAGARLDRLVADRVPGLSRSQAQALIAAGHVSQAGATIAEPSYRVKPGQEFHVVVPPPAPAKPVPEAVALDILYEDAHLVVLDKPAGMVVHPAPGATRGTLVNALLAHCGASLSGIGGVRRPGIVHRLDKDTSGLMVVAKDDETHRDLAAQFAGHTVTRVYRALVWGTPRPAEGRIEGNIGRATHDRKKMAVVEKGGKPAATNYRVIRRVGRAASSRGMPAGDGKDAPDSCTYGADRPPRGGRYDLWRRGAGGPAPWGRGRDPRRGRAGPPGARCLPARLRPPGHRRTP